MDIEVDVTMTRARLGAILRQARRWRWWMCWIVGVLCFVVGVVTMADGGITPMAVADVVVGLVLCSFPWLIAASAYRQLRKRMAHMVWSYRFTEDEIVQSTPSSTVRWPWSSVRAVRETGDLWTFRLSPSGVIGLPKEVLVDDDQARLRALLRRKQLVPAV